MTQQNQIKQKQKKAFVDFCAALPACCFDVCEIVNRAWMYVLYSYNFYSWCAIRNEF